MVEILKVTKNKKSPKFIIQTNIDEYKLSEDTIVKFLVLKGKTFTDEEFNEVLKSEKDNDLFNKVLNYISYQMRSEYEIKKYLQEKDVQEGIDVIIDKLKSFGYLNDEELSDYIFSSVLKNKKGPKFLEQKLYEKRINENIINNILSKYDFSLEEKIIKEIVEKLISKKSEEPIKKQKQNIYNKLLRDGFSTSIVNSAINSLELIDNSDNKLEREVEKLYFKYREIEEKEKKQKIIRSLLNKGFEYSDILKKMNNI